MKLINLFQFYIFLNNVTLLNSECWKTNYFGSSKTLQNELVWIATLSFAVPLIRIIHTTPGMCRTA